MSTITITPFVVGGGTSRVGEWHTSHTMSASTQQMHLVGNMTALVSADLRTVVSITADGPSATMYARDQRYCVLNGIGVVECKPHADCQRTVYEWGKRMEIVGEYERLFVGPSSMSMTNAQRERLCPHTNTYGCVTRDDPTRGCHVYVWLFVVRPCGRIDQVIAVAPITSDGSDIRVPRGIVAVEDYLITSSDNNNDHDTRTSGYNLRAGGRWSTRSVTHVQLAIRASGAVADAEFGDCIHYPAANEALWSTFPEAYRRAVGQLLTHERVAGPTARSVVDYASVEPPSPVQLLRVQRMHNGKMHTLTLSYKRTVRNGDVAVCVYEFVSTVASA